MGPTEPILILIPLLVYVIPLILFVVLLVLAIRWFQRQERADRSSETVAVRRSLGERCCAHTGSAAR